MGEEYRVGVGKELALKVKIDRKNHDVLFMYCGMPNEKTFSVGVKEPESVFGGYGFNIFFPIGREEIPIQGADFKVIDVNPGQLTIECMVESKEVQ